MMCDVCNNGHESFLHYFFKCEALCYFLIYFLRRLLIENWGVEVELQRRNVG